MSMPHSLALCTPFMHRKQKLFSAASFARCVGVLALNSSHFHNRRLPLQHRQVKNLFSGLIRLACLGVVDKVDLVAAAVSERDLLLLLPLLFSTFGLLAPQTFIRSWVSAFRLSKSLHSISVGRSVFFTSVCMDHCSRKLGGSL